jgi:hypothetical protein
MSTVIYHNHHIIPRHAGGTDTPDNIVSLTVAEHAEAHHKLYEEYGRWQDKLAWNALSGHIGKEEIIKEKLIQSGKLAKGRKATPETRKKISDGSRGRKFTEEHKKKLRGPKHTEESKKKISEVHKGKVPWNKGMKFGPHSLETKKKISEALKARKRGPYTKKH